MSMWPSTVREPSNIDRNSGAGGAASDINPGPPRTAELPLNIDAVQRPNTRRQHQGLHPKNRNRPSAIRQGGHKESKDLQAKLRDTGQHHRALNPAAGNLIQQPVAGRCDKRLCASHHEGRTAAWRQG